MFFNFFYNPTVYYRVHNRPRLAALLNYMNPVKTIPAYLFKIQFNVILLSMHKVSQEFLSFSFHQNSDHKISHDTIGCHNVRSSLQY